MGSTEVLMYGTFIVLGFLFFVVYIYPRYFGKPKGPEIGSPNWRPRAVLIDKNIPTGFAEIISRTSYENGLITLKLQNKHGSFIKEYTDSEIVPLASDQVLADEGAPVFITKATKYGKGEYRAEIDESRAREQAAIQNADYWKREHGALRANIANEVDTQIKRSIEMKKSSSSQAFGDRPREYTP